MENEDIKNALTLCSASIQHVIDTRILDTTAEGILKLVIRVLTDIGNDIIVISDDV